MSPLLKVLLMMHLLWGQPIERAWYEMPIDDLPDNTNSQYACLFVYPENSFEGIELGDGTFVITKSPGGAYYGQRFYDKPVKFAEGPDSPYWINPVIAGGSTGR